MSDARGGSVPRTWGDAGERAVSRRVSGLTPVSSETPEWDLRARETVHAPVLTPRADDCERPDTDGRETPLDGRVLVRREIPDGTPVEAKTAAWRVRDGSSRRRGRVKVRRDNHRALVAADGLYAVAVYRPDSREATVSDVLAVRLVEPSVVETAVSGWATCEREDRDAGTAPWSRFFKNLQRPQK